MSLRWPRERLAPVGGCCWVPPAVVGRAPSALCVLRAQSMSLPVAHRAWGRKPRPAARAGDSTAGSAGHVAQTQCRAPRRTRSAARARTSRCGGRHVCHAPHGTAVLTVARRRGTDDQVKDALRRRAPGQELWPARCQAGSRAPALPGLAARLHLSILSSRTLPLCHAQAWVTL